MFTDHIYLINIYKPDLTLNNLQCLICHKTKPNQSNERSHDDDKHCQMPCTDYFNF